MLYCKCSIKLKNKKPEEDLKCVKRRDQNPCRKPQSGRHEGGRLSEKTGVQCCAVRLQSTGDTA